MRTQHEDNQFSIAGLLFVTVGVAICCAAIPYLYELSPMSPPWSVFAVIVLMFAWAMVALRAGPSRAWWIGFLVTGIIFLSIAVVVVPKSVSWLIDATHDAQGQPVPAVWPLLSVASFEIIVVFTTLIVSLILLVSPGSGGGFIARNLYRRRTSCQSCGSNTSPSNRSALP